jgi:hypothetical protein
MADGSFVDKEVVVRFEVTETVAWKGVVVADDESGITLRRPYRKGVRLERIPRDQIRGVIHEIEKGPRRKQGASGGTAQEPDAEDFDDDGDGDGFENEPSTEWDDE